MARQTGIKRHRKTGTTVYIDGKKHTLIRTRKGLYYTQYTTNVYQLKKKLKSGEPVKMYRYSKTAMKARAKYQQMSEVEKEFARASSRARYHRIKGTKYAKTKKYQQIIDKMNARSKELRELGKIREAVSIQNIHSAKIAAFGQFAQQHPERTPDEIGKILDADVSIGVYEEYFDNIPGDTESEKILGILESKLSL